MAPGAAPVPGRRPAMAVARLLVVPALLLTRRPAGPLIDRLIWMDGQWFRLIAIDWYDRPYVDGRWSEYPFFPLFPTLGGAADEARAVPPTVGPRRHLVARRPGGDGRRLPPRRAPPAAGRGAVGAVVPGHRPGRGDDGARLRRQPVPRRARVGAGARRGPAVVGGGTRSPPSPRRAGRTGGSPSSPSSSRCSWRGPDFGRSSPSPRRRWCSSSGGASTCAGRRAIPSCSGRRRMRGSRSRCRRCSPTRSPTRHWPALFHLDVHAGAGDPVRDASPAATALLGGRRGAHDPAVARCSASRVWPGTRSWRSRWRSPRPTC